MAVIGGGEVIVDLVIVVLYCCASPLCITLYREQYDACK